MQEVADHIKDRAIQHDEAELDRLIADRLHDKTLARAGWAQIQRPGGSHFRFSRTLDEAKC
jgi:hypothetical protein